MADQDFTIKYFNMTALPQNALLPQKSDFCPKNPISASKVAHEIG
jgi:hypothetical protein